jgi:adenylate kinase
LVAAVPSFDPFPLAGSPARRKVLILGSEASLNEALRNEMSSLHIEHVSPANLMRRGISRPTSNGFKTEEALLAAFRRWFWTRKPDAGFILTDFPATLLQAKVFDEWLEARSEALDLVAAGTNASDDVVAHYRNLGLLWEANGGIAQ